MKLKSLLAIGLMGVALNASADTVSIRTVLGAYLDAGYPQKAAIHNTALTVGFVVIQDCMRGDSSSYSKGFCMHNGGFSLWGESWHFAEGHDIHSIATFENGLRVGATLAQRSLNFRVDYSAVMEFMTEIQEIKESEVQNDFGDLLK